MADRNEPLVHARFFMHTVPNESKSKKEGRPIFDDIEHVEIRFAANKQTTHVAPAHEVFRTERNFATGEVTPITYAMAYNEQYQKFKNNEAQDQAGTPLAELPFLTQAKRLELKALNIHTAETLAALDGQPLKRLGMGGRELKNMAQTYIENAKGSVDVTQMAAQIAVLQERLAKFESGNVAETGEKDEEGEKISPFQDWEAEDIRNWIAENHGETPRSNASHASLVNAADELNLALKKKAEKLEKARA